MIVYGMNRSPLAQESTQDLALAPESNASAAVPSPVLAEGSSSELIAMGGVVRTDDNGDDPLIKK